MKLRPSIHFILENVRSNTWMLLIINISHLVSIHKFNSVINIWILFIILKIKCQMLTIAKPYQFVDLANSSCYYHCWIIECLIWFYVYIGFWNKMFCLETKHDVSHIAWCVSKPVLNHIEINYSSFMQM